MSTDKRERLSHDHRKAGIYLILVLVTVGVYFQVGSFEFINYDTDRYVYENKYVLQGLTIDSIRWALTSTYASNWHPVTWLSHMLDVQLFELNAGAHHLTNVLFHVANTLLLFMVLQLMTGNIWRSGFVAVLFAIHPLHVQSVAWIAERKDLLSTFFGLLAIWRYIHYVSLPSIGRYLPVLIMFILSLMAKPMLVTLPFVLILLDYWPLERLRSRFKSEANNHSQRFAFKAFLIMEKMPLLLVSVASCIVTILAQQTGGAVGSPVAYPINIRISNALCSYVGYIGKMFWPSDLAVFYPHPGALPAWRIAFAGTLLAAITCLAAKLVKSKPWLMVGWLWFLGTLVPVIGLVQVGNQAMADRYTYLPLIGLFIVIAWGGADLLERFHFQKFGLLAITAIITASLMIVSWGQVKTWQSSVTLFERALAVTKNDYVAHNNLGHYWLIKGRLNNAINHFAEAVEINPKFELAYLNLGVALAKQGKLDAAIRSYNRALQIKPGLAVAYNNLGNALSRQGKYQTAISKYRQAIEIDPNYETAYNGIGAALIRLGDIDKALTFFKKALLINPDYTDAKNNFNNTLAALRKKKDKNDNK